ncbi:MAG: S-adenosylmethionine:tRNA ribosyltransferase-isomerase [Leadbetterella sp.]|nr:S-adenosylmethionine:tRNA ribosyltransferase-isomerase [Leadbetterella sp.]
MKINISDYQYPLEDKQIARFPESPRDESRLLVYRKSEIEHARFKRIGDYLPENAHLVLNNTKVIPARLFFKRKTGALIEIFLLNPVEPSVVLPLVMEETRAVTWHCVIGNKRRWKEGEALEGEFRHEGRSLQLKAWLADSAQNHVSLEWEGGIPFSQVVVAYGNIPLPPYLNREAAESDKQDYQTIYSEKDGAVAAPTAGLHFTEAVFEELQQKGIGKSFVTLHVGAGTFLPVKEENALNHPMHSEQMVVHRNFIENLLKNDGFIVPVGTTSMRSLESLYWFGVKILEGSENPFFIEKLFPYRPHEEISMQASFEAILGLLKQENQEQLIGNTEIMIFPGYRFRVCKGLITNFHQPASTLLLLVAALIGEQNWKEVYRQARENNYRFLSFGDSSLLLP